MSKLSTESRKKIPKSEFGLPGERKYPINDKNHARNAKARVSQQVKAGNLSPSSKAKIDAKANKVLGQKPMSHVSKTKIEAHAKRIKRK